MATGNVMTDAASHVFFVAEHPWPRVTALLLGTSFYSPEDPVLECCWDNHSVVVEEDPVIDKQSLIA